MLRIVNSLLGSLGGFHVNGSATLVHRVPIQMREYTSDASKLAEVRLEDLIGDHERGGSGLDAANKEAIRGRSIENIHNWGLWSARRGVNIALKR